MFKYLHKHCRHLILSISLAGLLLTACEQTPRFHHSDISGITVPQTWQLVDQDGKTRQMSDFKGKVVAVFFGFTQCQGPCPIAMGEWSAVNRALGEQQKNLQILFVTIDPEHDQAPILKNYLQPFGTNLIGLRGSDDAIAAMAKNFQVNYRKEPLPQGEYTMAHNDSSYVFDKEGNIRLLVTHGHADKPLTMLIDDMQQLVK